MNDRRLRKSFAALAMAAMAACSAEGPLQPETATPAFDVVTGEQVSLVYVCKAGLDVSTIGEAFEFVTEATGEGVIAPSATVVAESPSMITPHYVASVCKLVFSGHVQPGTMATVTELAHAGFELEGVRIWDLDAFFGGPGGFVDVAASDGAVTFEITGHGKLLIFKNREDTPEGGEGCTPGYWRQPHHYDSWVGYDPSDSFSDVFGVGPDTSLGAAVQLEGGGANALMRHAVAALLNASSPDVDYPLDEFDVIDLVQSAFSSGDFEDTKDLFDELNNAGCTLN